jgi:hypothetical protein
MAFDLNILQSYDPITLEEMDSVKLMNRMDVKYIFHRDILSEILEEARNECRVLEVDRKRCCAYATRYFDTPELKMYHEHHNGRRNRYKVRYRSYLDSGTTYFEIKFKNNKGRTIKDRIKVSGNEFEIQGESEFLLMKKTSFQAEMLKEALRVTFNRITLVSRELKERITLDTDLHFWHNGTELDFPALVIAEIKQDRTARSFFTRLLHDKRIHPLSLSKYCFGLANLKPDIKINNFKPKLLNVNKLCNSNP